MVGKNGAYGIVKVPHEKYDLPNPMREVELFAKVPVANQLKPSYQHRFANFDLQKINESNIRTNVLHDAPSV